MKNKDTLLDMIGETDEKFIPELTAAKKKNSILKWSAFAGVCAAAIIACVIALPKMNKNDSIISPYDNLPQVGNSSTKSGTDKIDPNVQFGDMGFEGLMAYDISELDTPNPWNPNLKISSLPVYRNLAYTNLRMAVYLSEEQMQEIAKNTASALNVDVNDTKVTYVKDFVQGGVSDEILNSAYSVDAKCSDNTAITVYGDGQIRINFEKQTLPSDYNFSYNSTSKEDAQKVLEYLSDKYDGLLHYDNAVCYSIADRTFSGDENRSYFVYDSSDDPVKSILNYNLFFTTFAPDDNGNLMCIWLNNPLCASEYLGDYPIITENEATEYLMNGKYFSSVPNDYIRNGTISKEDIVKTELVYRNNREKYYQPYYKYYVELDSETFNMADGLKNYGIFYVPAIESEYLEGYDPSVEYNSNKITEKESETTRLATESITSYEDTTISSSDRIEIGQNGFTIKIPNDFRYIGAEDYYEMTLQNEDKIYFGFSEWVMYTAEHPNITPNELAQNLQNTLAFTFNSENDTSFQQQVFCLNPASSENVNINSYPFEYQCGTMRQESDSENVYYYEAYFGVVPCIYRDSNFDIKEAPTFWYVFTDSQNEDAKQYVHETIKEIVASASYNP